MVEIPDDSRRLPAQRLADAAMELCLEAGLGALSARALGARSGFSASAMTYHFGGRAALVRELQQRAHVELAAWRTEIGDLLDQRRPVWLGPPAWITAALADLLERRRLHLALLWELEAEGELDAGGLHEDVEREVAAMHGFWVDGARRAGAAPEAAETWANLAEGLAAGLVAEADPARRAAWTFDAVARVDARLRGAATAAVPDTPLAASEQLAAPPGSEGARKILDAALRVVAERGVDRLTQRDVAAAAGVSLAATTYFFRTKNDLLHAAFNELHRQVRSDVLEEFARGDDVFSPRGLLDAESTLGWRVRAMEALHRAAVRDQALRPLARDILSTRGATSLSVLRGSGVAHADPLDAFVWSLSMSAVVRRVRMLPPAARNGALAEIGRRQMRVLFRISA